MWFSGKDGKECRICGEWKKFEDYSKQKNNKDGHKTECKKCQSANNKKRQEHLRAVEPMTTLIIPDLQAPFHHPDALHFLEAVIHRFKPQEIVSGGDELDLYALNDYGRDPDHDNPEGEFAQACEFMQKFFKLCPDGVGLKSNHVHGRMERKRQNARILSHWLKPFEEIINAPKGWKWVDEYVTQNTLMRHGHNDGKSAKANLEKINKYRMFSDEKPLNMLCCHHHTELWTQDVQMGQHIVQFGFCGSLIDRTAPAFRYTNKPPALGCKIIRDERQYNIVMYVDKHGRWTGEL